MNSSLPQPSPTTHGEMLTKASAVRAQCARLLNATPEEIGFVFATTEGENAVANNLPMHPRDNVAVDDLHCDGALVVYRELEKRRGRALRIVRHPGGVVSAKDIAQQVDNRTRLISLSLVSSINELRHDGALFNTRPRWSPRRASRRPRPPA
ncbi:MAG: aminotransferase class V-fold PLP-dependent enzyme, partial [Gemmatimonadota bacterium]|nr:aminotransferase class V-fold PLP-dependent enzyme [Gemmatimonadota bacterium]